MAASLARNPFVKLLCSHCMLSCSNCRVICKSKTQHFYRVFLSMKNHNAQRATVQLTSMMASFSSSSASGEMEKTHSEFEPVIGRCYKETRRELCYLWSAPETPGTCWCTGLQDRWGFRLRMPGCLRRGLRCLRGEGEM